LLSSKSLIGRIEEAQAQDFKIFGRLNELNSLDAKQASELEMQMIKDVLSEPFESYAEQFAAQAIVANHVYEKTMARINDLLSSPQIVQPTIQKTIEFLVGVAKDMENIAEMKLERLTKARVGLMMKRPPKF